MTFHIIDDGEIIRQMMQAMLSDAGYHSLCFKSGDEYIEHLNSPDFENPVAVLTDITMPGISGYELALQVRKAHPSQMIIFISGDADPARHKKAIQESCHILKKPFVMNELLSMLSDLVLPCYQHFSSENKKENLSKCINAGSSGCPFSV